MLTVLSMVPGLLNLVLHTHCVRQDAAKFSIFSRNHLYDTTSCCTQGFLSAMGVLSKVSMLLFTACFMQIPFREHLLVQGIQVC